MPVAKKEIATKAAEPAVPKADPKPEPVAPKVVVVHVAHVDLSPEEQAKIRVPNG